MKTGKFTQFGTFSVAVMLPIFFFCLIMMFTSGLTDLVQLAVLGFVSATFMLCLLIFYKLTIYIDDTHITFKLGIGLVTKKYLISDIKSCQAVKNSPLYGIGIRKIPKGWLYNVSGLEAIELKFKNKESLVRIGTNNPETVSETINRLIKNEKYETKSYYEKGKTVNYFSVIIIFLALILPAILMFTGSREPIVETNDEAFTIKGMYGLTVKYPDILLLDTIANLPGIKSRTNGFEFGKILKGNFTLTNRTRVKLFIKKDNPPYILIKTEELVIYLNCTNPANTVDIYKQIMTGLINTGKEI